MSEQILLGNPINTLFKPILTDDNQAWYDAFDFNSFENVVIYLFTNRFKIIKLSVETKTGYLPLTIIDAKTLKIEVPGSETKQLTAGEMSFEVYFDNAAVQDDNLAGTQFGIKFIDNYIKSEV